MQFESKQRRSKLIRHAHDIERVAKSELYHLQMYDVPPGETIGLAEFDEIAIARLRILKKVEEYSQRVAAYAGSEEDKHVSELIKKQQKDILEAMPSVNSSQRDRRNDVVGHYILRLAFCKSVEDTKWLVTNEIALFKMRFQSERKPQIAEFMRRNNFGISILDENEKEELTEFLASGSGLSPEAVRFTEFWKADMLDALELVRTRRVFLSDGFALVPVDDLLVIITSKLRAAMNGAMARARRHFGVLEEEDRLLPRLMRLANGAYAGKEYSSNSTNSITRRDIDSLSSSFPLCMSSIHARLRADHHLRHGARRQYGLFLKAAGLSMDEALAFFREEFTKKIEGDNFDKQYSYNIRHSYGKEGCRKEYKAFSCTKIILSNPPASGDCHGCPYKHLEPEALCARLEVSGVKKEAASQIVALAKASQYDRACTLHFEIRAGIAAGGLGELVSHPNQYFENMQQMKAGKRTARPATQKEIEYDITEESPVMKAEDAGPDDHEME